jgi:palmitoyltransferase ZDHHC9/14/18
MRGFLFGAYKRKTDQINDDIRNKFLAVINARLTKIKFCNTCDIYRPPRTIQCGTCGCCIERLDHHCPWVGTCIGKRNYKYFILFMWSVFIMSIYSIVLCSIHINDNSLNINSIYSGKLSFSVS